MQPFGDLKYRLAGPRSTRLAIELSHLIYKQDLGHVPEDRHDSSCEYLIAENGADEIIATLRFVGPESRPFDFEEYVDLSAWLKPGARAALVGRLAVRPDYRKVRQGQLVQLGIFKLVFALALKRSVSDVLTYTFEDLVRFYENVMFRPIAEPFLHSRAAAKMQVLGLHIDQVVRATQDPRQLRSKSFLRLLDSDLPNFQV
jgi:predicted GNAT family N-acyltransferase